MEAALMKNLGSDLRGYDVIVYEWCTVRSELSYDRRKSASSSSDHARDHVGRSTPSDPRDHEPSLPIQLKLAASPKELSSPISVFVGASLQRNATAMWKEFLHCDRVRCAPRHTPRHRGFAPWGADGKRGGGWSQTLHQGGPHCTFALCSSALLTRRGDSMKPVSLSEEETTVLIDSCAFGRTIRCG